MEMMTDRRPQIKDVLILDEREYVIQAIDGEEDSMVLTLLGVANSATFVLKGAQLRWQDMLRAWRPVNLRDFFEREEPTSDQ